MITLKNLYLGILDQMPLKRFLKNIFITGNARGLFYKRSHLRQDGIAKVSYPTKEIAKKVAEKMGEKHNIYFSNYKCIYCDGYHLGRNQK